MIQFSTPSVHLTHPSGNETELFFVRHGQTSANVMQQFAGSTDVPLDETGRYQASRVAHRFREIPLDAIVSSPLQRAHYTAQQIGKVTGHEPVPMPGIQEMHFGDAEMLTYTEIQSRWPLLFDEEINRDLPEFRWPNGESDIEFMARILNSMNTVMASYPGQRVAMVCHGGVIAQVLNFLDGGGRAGHMRFSITNCSITHLSVSSSQTRINCWNDHTHLDQVLGPLDLGTEELKEVAP